MNSSTTSLSEKPTKYAKTIGLRNSTEADLSRLCQEGMLSLSLEEMKTIQKYFQHLDREPTDVELETLAQTWSEHCVHKTFKGFFHYVEEDLGELAPLNEKKEKAFSNLFKDTIVKTTEELNMPWCLSVFKDNAGVIEFDDETAVSFKVETHNHPSALEPYGGAGTGVGGVIRDVLGCGLGGKPVLNTDVFCFGELNTKSDELPTGALHPKRIAKGVIAGVRDYGNRMGIPTANGTLYFDAGYTGNPLVFCGTVGYMPKRAINKKVESGDLVVTIGGRTGRDGIHGATFSSAPLESGITSNVVQIGNAIMEKKFMDVLLAARDRGLYRSVTDCGAGGFSSAVGELGQETGVRIQLEKAPLKYEGLAPWEIWLSESQERMILAVPRERWNILRVLFEQEDVEATVMGEFTTTKKLVVIYKNEVVAELDMEFLHNGIPKLELDAKWNTKLYQERHTKGVIPAKGETQIANLPSSRPGFPIETFGNDDISEASLITFTLKWLLQHPVIASKETIVRQYDHEVQGGVIIKPYMGVSFDGPTDACVFRPNLKSWRGVGVSHGLNPEVGKYDPYLMAKLAVDEAYRNLIAVGGGLKHSAILDNFCWGDAKDPYELGALVRAAKGGQEAALAYKLPFISGKDSFNNTWKSSDGTLQSIPATLLISAMGVIEDVRRCLTSSLKKQGSLIYVVGQTDEALKGSLANQLWQKKEARLPTMDLAQSASLYKKVQNAMRYKLIISCHDVSEGGIAVAAAEMAFGSSYGIRMDLAKELKDPAQFLFSETPSRFLVEIAPERKYEFEQMMGPRSLTLLGTVISETLLEIEQRGKTLFNETVEVLKTLWKKPLSEL